MKDTSTIKSQMFQSNPRATAVVSKLISSKTDMEGSLKESLSTGTKMPEIKKITQSVYSKIKGNEDIIKMFPDIEIAIKIIVSAILCPNDVVTTNLVYDAPKDIRIPDTVKKMINNTIKDYIIDNYDLENSLYNIIREALFIKGAYVEAIIPEASVDDIINSNNDKLYTEDKKITYENYKNLVNPWLKSNESNFINKFISTENTGLIGKLKLDEYLSKQRKLIENFISNNKTYVVKSEDGKSDILRNLNITIESNFVTNYNFSLKDGNGKKYDKKMKLPYITDDISILKSSGKIIDAINASNENIFRRGKGLDGSRIRNMDDIKGTNDREDGNENLDKIFKYLETPIDEEFIMVKDADSSSRKSISKPMIMKIPVTSIVPIHAPNDPSKHIGYFVMLDEDGQVLDTGENIDDDYLLLNTNSGYSHADASDMLDRSSDALYGFEQPDVVMDKNNELYIMLVKNMVNDKIKSGNFGDLAILEDDMKIYQIMFNRALRDKGTQLLFIPESMVQYYAYEYRENGTGKSLLEKVQLLASIRAILFVTSILARLKNGISTTELEITLDDIDKYPQETLESIIQTAIKNREPSNGLGLTRLSDIYDWIVEHQYKVNINANNLPDMKVNVEDTNRNVTVPDEEFQDKLLEMILLSIGITPEMVNKGKDIEFATTLMNEQLIFAKDAITNQRKTNVMITNHVIKIFKNDFELRDKVRKNIVANKKKILNGLSSIKVVDGKKELIPMEVNDEEFEKVVDYIMLKWEDMKIRLPEIQISDDSARAKNVKARFDEIDMVVDSLLDSDILQTCLGEEADKIGSEIVSVLKTYLKRKMVIENGFYSDITDMFLQKRDLNIEDERVNIFKASIDDLKTLVLQLADAYPSKVESIRALTEEFGQWGDFIGIDSNGGSGSSSFGGGDSGDSGDTGDSGDEGEGSEGGDGGGGDEFNMDQIDDMFKE